MRPEFNVRIPPGIGSGINFRMLPGRIIVRGYTTEHQLKIIPIIMLIGVLYRPMYWIGFGRNTGIE